MTLDLRYERYETHQELLEARRATLGASDLARLLDPIKGKGAWWLWLRKHPRHRVENAEAIAEEDARAMATINGELRRSLETFGIQYANDWLEGRGSTSLVFRPLDPDYLLVRNPELPGIHCSPDALVLANNREDVETTCQIKTVHTYEAWRWATEPDTYTLLQVHAEGIVTGAEWALVQAIIGYGDDPKRDRPTYEVPLLPDLKNEILAAADRMTAWLASDEEPPPDGFDETTRAIRLLMPGAARKPARVVTAGADMVPIHSKLQAIERQLETTGRERERLRQMLELDAARLDATDYVIPETPTSPAHRYLRYSYTRDGRQVTVFR